MRYEKKRKRKVFNVVFVPLWAGLVFLYTRAKGLIYTERGDEKLSLELRRGPLTTGTFQASGRALGNGGRATALYRQGTR